MTITRYSEAHLRDAEDNPLFVRVTSWVDGKPTLSDYFPLEGWETKGKHQIPVFNGGTTERDYMPEGVTFTVLKEVEYRAEGMNEPTYAYETFKEQ